MKPKITVLGNPTCVDEGILKNMGDEALGVYSASWYTAAIDTPDNKRFVEAMQAEYKVTPGFYTAGTYTSGLLLEEALKASRADSRTSAAFVRALHDARWRTGRWGRSASTNTASRSSTFTSARSSARTASWSTPPSDLPDVSQFWTYDSKQFLASSTYSRDYPTSKNLE